MGPVQVKSSFIDFDVITEVPISYYIHFSRREMNVPYAGTFGNRVFVFLLKIVFSELDSMLFDTEKKLIRNGMRAIFKARFLTIR